MQGKDDSNKRIAELQKMSAVTTQKHGLDGEESR